MIEGEPRPFRWTAEEYYRATDAGVFFGRREQLIDGMILEFDATTNYHAVGVEIMRIALHQAFGEDFWVRSHGPLDLSSYSVPEPDLAVVRGGMRSHRNLDTPTTAVLIVEVSDTTLKVDRETKAALYAASGIEEYWILNVVDGRLEVYREPIPETNARLGWFYRSRSDLQPGDSVSPLALPGASIAVADLLP